MLRSFTRALDVTSRFPGGDVSKLAMQPLSFPQNPDLASIQSVSDSGGLEQEPEEPEVAATFPDQINPPAQVTTVSQPVPVPQANEPHHLTATGPSPSANGFLKIPGKGKGPTVPLPATPSASEPIPPPRRPPPVYQGEPSALRSNHVRPTRKRPDLPNLDAWYENRDSFLNMEMEIEQSSATRASERTLLNSLNYDEPFPPASSSQSITEVAPSGSTRISSQSPDVLSRIRPVEVPSSDLSDSSESACADSERSGNQNLVRQLWSFIKTGSKSQAPSRLGTPKSSSAASIQAPSVNSTVSDPPNQDASGSGQGFIDYYPEGMYPYRRERAYSYYINGPSAKEGSVYTALSISFPSWLCCCSRRGNADENDEFH
ncbi:hypothetical protein JVU11DRAFT_12793 [Chiua virens]|nr:hypothetical protein JVU11DRAFT_12793 [Chiua virens]